MTFGFDDGRQIKSFLTCPKSPTDYYLIWATQGHVGRKTGDYVTLNVRQKILWIEPSDDAV